MSQTVQQGQSYHVASTPHTHGMQGTEDQTVHQPMPTSKYLQVVDPVVLARQQFTQSLPGRNINRTACLLLLQLLLLLLTLPLLATLAALCWWTEATAAVLAAIAAAAGALHIRRSKPQAVTASAQGTGRWAGWLAGAEGVWGTSKGCAGMSWVHTCMQLWCVQVYMHLAESDNEGGGAEISTGMATGTLTCRTASTNSMYMS